MNRGKTATIIDINENIDEEIQDYLNQRELEKEEYDLINSFRKFAGAAAGVENYDGNEKRVHIT